MQRRHFSIALPLAAAAAAHPPMAFAQAPAWPTKTITIVVPYVAGGGVDTVARLVSGSLSEALGRSVVVENRPGVSGIVGAQYVARAAPDGYTLLAGNLTTDVMNGLLVKSPGYDAARDFAPIALLNSFPTVLVVAAQSRFHSLADVAAALRAEPDGLTFGSSGIGSAHHLAAELFQSATKTKMRHIPYKGGPAVMADLVGGQLDMAFEVVPVAAPLVRSGRLRALAVTSQVGMPALPGVKPVADLGYPGFEMVFWNTMSAPAGTPPAIVERLGRALAQAVAKPAFQQRMVELGAIPEGRQGAELRAFEQAERAKWSAVAQQTGMKPE